MKIELKCGKETESIKLKSSDTEKCKTLMYILHGEALKKTYFPDIVGKAELTCKVDGEKMSIPDLLNKIKNIIKNSLSDETNSKKGKKKKKKDKTKSKKKNTIKLDKSSKKKDKKKKKKDKDKNKEKVTLQFGNSKKDDGLVHIGHRIS